MSAPNPADPTSSSDARPVQVERVGRIGILGCGAVGRAFAHALADRSASDGVALALWSRTPANAAALAAELASEGPGAASVRVSTSLDECVASCEVALLTVTDRALADVVARIARVAPVPSGGPGEGLPVLLHTNGTFGLDVFAPLGAPLSALRVGKVHPLAAVSPSGPPSRDAFAGVWFGALATPGARDAATRLVEAVRGRMLWLEPAGDGDADGAHASLALHAAASLLSGGVVALFDLAVELARDGVRSDDVDDALAVLLDSTVRNVEANGARAALTGAISRGAVELVERHLGRLDRTPDGGAVYRVLGRRMLALAVARGTVDEEARAALERLLAD